MSTLMGRYGVTRMAIEAAIRPSILDESTFVDEWIEQAPRWDTAGLTPKDVAAWLPPGRLPELECDALAAIDFTLSPVA